jgi:serine/threonine protein kinase
MSRIMSTLVQDSWPEPPRNLQPGTRLGAELIVKCVLGHGGTATVYEARHTALGLDVAVKVCSPGEEVPGESRARLQREARVYAQVKDPRLPRVYVVDQLEDGTAFMAMEKLDGCTLATLLDAGPLTIERACRLTIELLDVLETVHGHGVVHRDVKPANVIVPAVDGAPGQLRLIDFGVCKVGGKLLGATAITRHGEILGTPAYMAPEQLTAQPVDHRVDVHATGLILFELLTGNSPYGQGSFGEVVAAVLRDELPDVRSRRPEVPAGIAGIIARATAKRPSGRFPSAAAMRDALQAALNELAATAGTGASSEAQAPRPGTAEPESVVRTVRSTRRRGARRTQSRLNPVISPHPTLRVTRQFA